MNRKILGSVGGLVLAAASVFFGVAAAGEGALLGIPIGHPQVNSNPIGTCEYDGAGTLTLHSQPVSFNVTPDGDAAFVFYPAVDPSTAPLGGVLVLTASISTTGVLSGGTFTLQGWTYDPSDFTVFGPTLLTGTVDAYGAVDNGFVDSMDFEITPTGGDIFNSLYNSGDKIGVAFQLTGSGYTFDSNTPANSGFAGAWDCDGPKGTIGPIPGGVQCDLTLVKTANPTTIGPIPEDPETNCECSGKVSRLVLQYNGPSGVDVLINRAKKFTATLLTATNVQTGDLLTVLPPNPEPGPGGFAGSLGTDIEIIVNGGQALKLHTSCSTPIGPGTVVGDFVVVEGSSRTSSLPLCPQVPNPPCPVNQRVTYTFVVTNNGTPVTNVQVTDDVLIPSLIGTAGALGTGASVQFTREACLYETTVNTATVTASSGSGSCSASDSATVTLNVNNPPPPPPPDPIGTHGCSHGFWKQIPNHQSYWVGVTPADTFESVFMVSSAGMKSNNPSLLTALKQGGGGIDALGREAVAALLNANNTSVDYAYTAAQVKSMVQSAFISQNFDAAKNLLEEENTSGCPF